MKKLLTLSLGLLTATAASAFTPTEIFSYEVTETDRSISVSGSSKDGMTNMDIVGFVTGGKLEGVGASGFFSKCTLTTDKNAHFCITLSNDLQLQEGDEITFSDNDDTPDELSSVIAIYADNNREADSPSTDATYVVKSTDEKIIGLNKIYFSGTSKTAVRLTKVTITRTKETTAEDEVVADQKAAKGAYKTIRDGRIVIVRDGVEYDINGHRLN